MSPTVTEQTPVRFPRVALCLAMSTKCASGSRSRYLWLSVAAPVIFDCFVALTAVRKIHSRMPK
jgi:hypothetical protein